MIEVRHYGAAARMSAVIVVDRTRSSARPDASFELLTVLHRCGRRIRALGGRLSVACSRPELRRLFDATLLSQGVDVYASRAEALCASA